MRIKFDVIEEKNGKILFVTNAEGNEAIRSPLLYKGSAYSETERKLLSLDGLIPPKILSIEQQIAKVYERYKRLGTPFDKCHSCHKFKKTDYEELKKIIDLARFNFLCDLHDRNEILFYALCDAHLAEVVPIIYTPTVGEAILRYSRDSARFRGIFLSPHTINSVDRIFDHFWFKRPTIAVVTDNQGILGLGDQGVAGIDIPIGKLALYVLGAGIRPWETLPLTLDVGTDNKDALKDPLYLGYKKGRLHGDKYEEFIDTFVEGVNKKFPNILIQWEDFSRQNAFDVLDKYRHKILSFNDDIQGTGSVTLAGILNAMKAINEELKNQKIVIYGAGAGGIGIARQIVTYMCLENKVSEEESRKKIVVLDSKGMVADQRDVENYKKDFSKNKEFYKSWEIENASYITLLDVIKNFQPTILLGTSGRPNDFTSEVLKTMSDNTQHPIIFPLSNPNTKCEAKPIEIYKITKGKALVATGSPFEPFTFHGKKITIGQCNNFFIFPGIGLGAILSKADYISDNVFTEAAITLSELTPKQYLDDNILYPPFTNIRKISARIALVTNQIIAHEQGKQEYSLEEIESKMWKPGYHTLIKI